MTTVTTEREFERVTCSRCMGSGQYSYCQTMTGPYGAYTCFKCVGVGRMLTKRGKVAYQLLVDSLSIPRKNLQVGQSIHMGRWEKVLEVRPGTLDDGARIVDGEQVPYELIVRTDRGYYMGYSPDSLVRVAHSKEQKRRKIDLAYEYQELLTKQGKVRKGREDEAARIEREISAI